MSDNEMLVISLKGNKRVRMPSPSEPDSKLELIWARSIGDVELEEYLYEGEVGTFDSCMVELDGKCPHGYKSPFLLLHMI
ncbi:MAG: hypothetical protein IIC67_00280 [Thaumarchaeota archaeon]|nr:hypothetical protein [Nitrososphaerota archaeon]